MLICKCENYVDCVPDIVKRLIKMYLISFSRFLLSQKKLLKTYLGP